MAAFREEHDEHFLEQAKASRQNKQDYVRWAADIATWLNDTNHISVRYDIQYDGVAIEQLSPGTRGIVLLLLYLAVDQSDDRPLIIDQPEENLDPSRSSTSWSPGLSIPGIVGRSSSSPTTRIWW